MTFLHVNGYIDIDASLDDPEFGVWLEQVINQKMTFTAFVQRLNERLQHRLNLT